VVKHHRDQPSFEILCLDKNQYKYNKFDLISLVTANHFIKLFTLPSKSEDIQDHHSPLILVDPVSLMRISYLSASSRTTCVVPLLV
jgi:hypothetical protein